MYIKTFGVMSQCPLILLTGHFFVIVGESLAVFQSELGEQKKLVKSLQKKSLWSKNLEEVYNYEHMLLFLKRENFDIWIPSIKI